MTSFRFLHPGRLTGTAATLLALAAWLSGCGPEDRSGPAAGSVERRVTERPGFDGARAFALVERQVGFGPRVPGSAGHEAQLAWMLELLRARADSVVVDPFTHVTSAGVTLPLTNVRAVWTPPVPRPDGRRLLLLAHWDTRPRSDNSTVPGADTIPVPGANDGASGVAVLLELSRLLTEQAPPVTVDLLFVDGEDYGPTGVDMYLGSRRFARRMAGDYEPAYGILLDMVGDVDPSFPIEGYSAERAPQVAQRVWSIARELGYGPSFPQRVGTRIGDDHLPLNDAGLPTIDIIDFTYGGPDSPWWHTPEDRPEHVSAATLDMVGEVVAEVVYRGG